MSQTDNLRHIMGCITLDPNKRLIELGRLLVLRYGNADNPLWLEFEHELNANTSEQSGE